MRNMNERVSAANRVTWVGLYFNLVLTAFKFFAGVVGHSGAMIADAVHSLSDFATDIVVLVGFRFVGQPPDKGHDYGHGKYETLATAVIGAALLLVGVSIFRGGAVKIGQSLIGQHLKAPGGIAFVAAVLSILVKEGLYRYTVITGRRINSQALIANAWHHRSDALSSIGTMLGIGGAIALGEKWHILDPIAAVVVSLFVIKVAIEILSGSLKELMEGSLTDEVENEILQIASAFPGVTQPHNLRTRRIGAAIAVDLHIRVPCDMRVDDAHQITAEIESAIRKRFGHSTFVSIHVEPTVAGGSAKPQG